MPLPREPLRREDVDRVSEQFMTLYQQRYGHLPESRSLEFLSWRVTVSGPRPPMRALTSRTQVAPAAPHSSRRAYFGKAGFVETPVYDRYRMTPGMLVNSW